ncbi:MAG: V-type ATP synthase subunit F [Xanthomonadales bacterium]|nr:V-type ATP synthase subunit F [Xanthomonadales bacterium]
MKGAVFIGDELTALGYALAGMDSRTPPADQVDETFRRARDEGATLILLTAESVAQVDQALLNHALTACHPPVVVVPDARDRAMPTDWAREVKQTLGIGGR